MMKKVFFKQRNLEIGECNGIKLESCRNLFPPEKISAQTQGMKKRNHEIFGVFQNLEKIFSQNIFSRKKKIFEMKYILRISSQILENPKNFMILFFHPLNLSGVVLGENLSSLLSKGLSGKSVLITFISSGLRRKLFLPFIFKLLQIQSQINHNPINRFH